MDLMQPTTLAGLVDAALSALERKAPLELVGAGTDIADQLGLHAVADLLRIRCRHPAQKVERPFNPWLDQELPPLEPARVNLRRVHGVLGRRCMRLALLVASAEHALRHN